MSDFKNLRVWQHSHAVTLQVYDLTRAFPASERYGLVQQIRRAAGSIGANIAESRGRFGTQDQRRFLFIARGSARELENHLILAKDLGILDPEVARNTLIQVASVERMLSALIGRV